MLRHVAADCRFGPRKPRGEHFSLNAASKPVRARFAETTAARRALARISVYVIGIRVARFVSEVKADGAIVNELEDIVDRAIDYTNLILRRAPSYRDSAISGLRTLRESLAEKAPDDPAVRKLDGFLDTLSDATSNKSI